MCRIVYFRVTFERDCHRAVELLGVVFLLKTSKSVFQSCCVVKGTFFHSAIISLNVNNGYEFL